MYLENFVQLGSFRSLELLGCHANRATVRLALLGLST